MNTVLSLNVPSVLPLLRALIRQHFLQCPPGVLNKHYEKLIQCDVRLNFLSQQPESALESPFFDTKATVVENLDELNARGLDPVGSGKGSPLSSIQDAASPVAVQSSSVSFEQPDLPDGIIPFPSSDPFSLTFLYVVFLHDYLCHLLFLSLYLSTFCSRGERWAR